MLTVGKLNSNVKLCLDPIDPYQTAVSPFTTNDKNY